MVKLLIFFGISAGVPIALLLLQHWLGKSKPTPTKELLFECGNSPQGNAWERFPIKFSSVALLFLIFDVEIVSFLLFVYGGTKLGSRASLGVLSFFGVLLVGFIYAWKMKALGWEE